MIYINLKTSTLRSPAYIGAEPVQRATWLSLLAYCVEQENAGIIAGADQWKDRQWQQTCGVTLAEVQDACDLWGWSGGALVVHFYPAEKEAEVQRNREAGRSGGKSRSEAKIQAARLNGAKRNPSTNPSENPSESQAEPKREPNGKERKGMGIGKEGGTAVPPRCVQTPDLPTFVSQCNLAGIPADLAEEIWHDNEGRGYAPTGEWLDHNGRPIASPVANAKSRSLAMSQRRQKNGSSGQLGGKKPPSVWEMRQQLEAAEKEAERLANNPSNKTYDATSFESRLKPEVAQQVKALRARAGEIRQQLAGAKEAA